MAVNFCAAVIGTETSGSILNPSNEILIEDRLFERAEKVYTMLTNDKIDNAIDIMGHV
nr:hypothetical protein [Paenibacillus brasilensis]